MHWTGRGRRVDGEGDETPGQVTSENGVIY